MCLIFTFLFAMLDTISTNSFIDTISSDPILNGPFSLEFVKALVALMHSSINKMIWFAFHHPKFRFRYLHL